MKPLFIYLLLVTGNTLHAQSIIANVGYNFMFSKTKVPIVNQVRSLTNHNYVSLNLESIVALNSLSISLSYINFRGWTNMRLRDERNFLGTGHSSTSIHRCGIIASYDLISTVRTLSLNPSIGVFAEIANETWDPYSFKGTFDPIRTPDYHGERYLELDGGFQIVPMVGLNIKWNPFWRVVLKLDYHFTYGFRPFQRLYHFYEYKGVPQPTAEWYSDGTAHFVSFGLGFRLGKDKWKY